jgi:CubicO group peptidase (beta-lactamase class C family)
MIVFLVDKTERVFRKLCLAILCLSFTISLSFAQEKNKMNEEFKKFDAFYQENVKKYGIIGSSFAFIHEDKLIDHQTYGMSHIANNYKTDENTIYHWASISKTLTGIAIMQLRDRGKLKLEDPITKYVPELRQVHNSFGSMDEITIAQLLSHTAGFRGGTFPFGGDKDWHPAEPTKWSQLVAMLPYTEILFKPGSKYSYSNPGIVYLGQVIERLSGEDFEVYMDKNILKPLEMYHSFYDTTPYHLLKHRSHSYEIDKNGKMTEGRFDMNTGITVSNGGLNSPFPDMIKYLKFLIGDPKKRDEYDLILKRSSLEEMWQPVIDVLDEPKDGKNRKDFIGKCFFIEENFGQRFIGHSGHQNNFIAHFYLNPATKSAYIVNFNTWQSSVGGDTKINTDTLDKEIKEYLFEKIFPLFKK